MNHFVWSPGALAMIEFLDPVMREPVKAALQLMRNEFDGVDIAIDCTLRTPAQAAANSKTGAGILTSKHLPNSKGYSEALDFRTVGKTPELRYALGSCRIIRGALFTTFDRAGVPTRNGSDWNCNGIEDPLEKAMRDERFDLGHHELVKPGEKRFEEALDGIARRNAARLRGERWPL